MSGSDAATFLEMATDSGTRELIPDPGHVDDRPYDEPVEPVETHAERMKRHDKLADARKDVCYRAMGMLRQLLRQGELPDYTQPVAIEIRDEYDRLTAELDAFWVKHKIWQGRK